MTTLVIGVNTLSAALTFLSLIGYSIQYLAALFALLLVDHYRIVIDEALQSVYY